MILGKDEYRIEDEGIWVSKKALEEARDHYADILHNHLDDEKRLWFYLGKADVCIDLLKHFELLKL